MTRTTPSELLHTQFGDIDIYLFDQIARGRFDGRRRILDAGCGAGRNLPFFLKHGFDVCAVDADRGAVEQVRHLAASLHAHLPADNFHARPLDALPWPDASFDAVICSAVLHFAKDAADFAAMVRELWRVLKPDGMFFARLATSIGIERVLPAPVGRVRLPDGSDRYVVDEATLLAWTEKLGGRLLDPIKTTNVQNRRAMTTWVVAKME